MAKLGSFRLAALGALLLTCVMQVALAQERFTREINFDIAAQSVEAALLEFSEQAGVQVMVGGTLNGQQTEGVKGKLSVTDGLRQLLKNTGLEYQTEGNNTITIRSVSAAKAGARVLPLTEAVTLAGGEPLGTGAGVESALPGGLQTLDEVVVVGSHIRGAASVAPILTFSAADIESTGYATAQDWIDTLPQNFGNTPSEEAGGIGNFNRGTGINLRGLGAGSTLVLINGRRQPTSGLDGDFVDVSSIPASAIERVEVLTDGASAIYGSDAIGGVVNFVFKKNYEGAKTKVRYAAASGGARETVASQLLGVAWASGSALFDYQYYDRTALQTKARDYSRTADKRAQGGSDFRQTSSNPGNILFGPTNFPIPSGQDGTSLPAADLQPGAPNLQNQLEGIDLLPSRRIHSAFLTVDQRIGENLSVFLEGRYAKREMVARQAAPAQPMLVFPSNAFYVNPTPLPFAIVSYSFFDDFGPSVTQGETTTYLASAGAKLSFGSDWQASLTASSGSEELDFELPMINQTALAAALASSDPATAFNPFGDGSHTSAQTLAAIRTLQLEKGESQIEEANLLVDGSLFSLPAGAAKLAFGADHRVEELERGATTQLNLDRGITSGFFELAIPLFSARNARPGLRQLALVAAGRYEDYSDFGDTFNPKVGVRFAPIEPLQLYASWGTSFKAPRIFDLENSARPANFVFQTPIVDPRSPTGSTSALIRSGGNAALQEETASTWTAGLTLKLRPLLTASLSYYDIEYEDRIAAPGPVDQLSILLQEDIWSSVLTRSPSRELIDEQCNDPNFIGSRAACLASTPGVIVDLRKQNIARTNARGLDLSIDQRIPTSAGTFGWQLLGTYVLDYEVGVSESSAVIEFVDTINNPVAMRLRGVGSWSRGGFEANVAINYLGDYEDRSQAQPRDVGSWNTVDLLLKYSIPDRSGWVSGLDIALSATNVLDKEPPFVNRSLGYDVTNASPIGRFVGVQLSKNWGKL